MARIGRSFPSRPLIKGQYGLLSPPVALPTFDSKTLSAAQAAGTTSFSWTHTIANQINRVLVVGVGTTGGDNVTAITFNGISLAKITSGAQGAGAGTMSMWILVGPPVGTFTIAVTLNSDATIGGAASFYNVLQSNFPNAQNNTGGFSATSSHSLAPTLDNCYVLEMIYWVNNAATTTGSVGWTTSILNDAGTAQSFALGLKGPISPASSQTNTWDNISRSWESVMISLPPFFDTTTPWVKISEFNQILYED